ncbi:MAG: cation transporter [Lachnospiraceae bacterium]|nr:cation transporter [Lachnospiraceae bacterium]
MVGLLAKIFIRDRKDTSKAEVRQAYGMLCGTVGILFNILLFLGKFIAGTVSHSIAITADAFNNLSDAGSSIITLIGFKMAGQKPDSDHPFGHGRIEYISGLIVSMVIVLMAFELLQGSVLKIIHPEKTQFSSLTLIILLVSILVKCYMAFYNHKIGVLIDSAAMKATSTDSLSDMLATTVVLICTLISHNTDIIIDGYCGVLVGLFILFAGFHAAKDTISPLLGQAPDPEFVQQINDIVMSYEGVIGIHDLIVHNYGPGRILISLHVEIPANSDILTMHDMIDLIEHKLQDTLHCSAVIHMDPVCIGDEETDRLKAEVTDYLAQIAPSLTMHDFRIVKGPTHTNIIFDVVVPYGFHMTDNEVISVINKHIKDKNPNYFTVIEVDKKLG